jgi:hypothetical protein
VIKAQRTGNRYLAGLVVALAALHLATSALSTALLWPERNHARLAASLALLGFFPAVAAALLGVWAWQVKGGRSASWSAAALTVLLAAIAASHWGAGAF